MRFKKFLLLFLILTAASLPSFAEKIPVKIAPLQEISTHHDEVETGDWIKFETANDVYVNDAIYIKRNTEVIGIVDFVHQNGWGGDCAQIYFKKFYTADVNGKKVEITSPLELKGNSEMVNSSKDVPESALYFAKYFVSHLEYATFILRGSEIDITPDTKVYNVFIER